MKIRQPRPAAEAVRSVCAAMASAIGPRVHALANRALRSGPYAGALEFPASRVALLFFEDFERDRLVRNDRLLRRGARKLYHAATRGQQASGYEVAFLALCTALRRAGWRVVVNDHALARRNPRHPVGIAGYRHVLERWRLPNPAVLGPGLLDHPAAAPGLMADPRFRVYLSSCAWEQALFEKHWPGQCRRWFAGIDLDAWPDLSSGTKDVDLLVYEKFHWGRERRVRELLDPLLALAAARGLSTRVLPYGCYELPQYRALLARSRALVWLSEHESQGLAYQEAMASGLPVLAWDQGSWIAPDRARYGGEPVPACSVPYFGPECGERFRSAEELPDALDRFVARLPGYRPREYVASNLSLDASAAAWLAACAVAAGAGR